MTEVPVPLNKAMIQRLQLSPSLTFYQFSLLAELDMKIENAVIFNSKNAKTVVQCNTLFKVDLLLAV